MNIKKRKLAIILAGLFVLSSCSISDTKPSDMQAINTESNASISMASSEAVSNSDTSLTIEVGEDNRTHISGTMASGIVVDANVIANCDISAPGVGYEYSAQLRAFTEEDRKLFVQEGWTLADTTSAPLDQGLFSGTCYYDTYIDETGVKYVQSTLPPRVVFYSETGRCIQNYIGCIEDKNFGKEDFSFCSMEEAYDQVASYLDQAGIPVSDCYEGLRIPYTELQIQQKIFASVGEDLTFQNEVLPNGFTEEDNAYLFRLRYDVNGFPVSDSLAMGYVLKDGEKPASAEETRYLSGVSIEALVTKRGIESIIIDFQLMDCQQTGSGELCSAEQALTAFSDAMKSPSQNDYLYIISNYANGPITFTDIELSYVYLWCQDSVDVPMIPCWQIQCERIYDVDDPQSGNVSMKGYVNAITGEYIAYSEGFGDI